MEKEIPEQLKEIRKEYKQLYDEYTSVNSRLSDAKAEIADLKRQLEKYETNRYDKDDDSKRDPWDDLGKNLSENTL